MAEFQFEHKIGEDYSNEVRVSVRVQATPSEEDYKNLIDAVDVITQFGEKYIEYKVPPVIREKVE